MHCYSCEHYKARLSSSPFQKRRPHSGTHRTGIDKHENISEKPVESFHMTSRRPYWCPKTMKRRHRGHSSGAPSDGMFPNTPEVSQIVFSVL